jgi:riboflavin kinase/FMN adenylyltransferase
MPVFASYEEFAASVSPLEACALVIGNFDGVHRGHQALIASARERVGSAGKVVALTFSPHPATVLAPQNAPSLLLSARRKRELLLQAGADFVVEQRFDTAFAQLDAQAFVERILLAGPTLRAVCVGHDFRFGRGRAGDGALLQKLLFDARGTEVTVLSAVSVTTPSGEQVTCSSTLIRRALSEGDLPRAELILGRPAELEGTVVHGAGRGRTISVPTANLRCHTDIKLRPGVYAAWAEILSETSASSSGVSTVEASHPAAVNVGYNPTFQGPAVGTVPPLSVEAHLLVADGIELPSLYDRELRLCFVARLRDERKFPSVAELVTQIRSDIATVRLLTGERR